MRKGERTQQRILEESVKLFNTKGYAGTHIRDIMDATGLAKGGIYGNFASKEDLELAAFDHGVKIVATALARELAEGGENRGAIEKLHALVGFYERYTFRPPLEGGCMILNTSIEADDTNPALRRRVVKAIESWRRTIVTLIREGIASGAIRSEIDPDEYAMLFIATIEGGIMLAKAYGNSRRLAAPLSHLHRVIDGELAAPPRPARRR